MINHFLLVSCHAHDQINHYSLVSDDSVEIALLLFIYFIILYYFEEYYMNEKTENNKSFILLTQKFVLELKDIFTIVFDIT